VPNVIFRPPAGHIRARKSTKDRAKADTNKRETTCCR
jgi:hypothetical protein